MHIYKAHLQSLSPYFQSRNYNQDEGEAARLLQESASDYEKRTWMHRTTINNDGFVVIPSFALHSSFTFGAKYFGERIKGRGAATWTKHFRSGIMVSEPIVLPQRRETVEGVWLFLNADGKSGGGTRVWRKMPVIRSWSGTCMIQVFDETITAQQLKKVIHDAGLFAGIGQGRPEKGNSNGRYTITNLEEISMEDIR